MSHIMILCFVINCAERCVFHLFEYCKSIDIDFSSFVNKKGYSVFIFAVSIYILLQLIGLFFSTLLLPELMRRNVKENLAPCFVVSNATNRVNESIQETLIDLIIRTEGATRIPKEIQTFVSQHLY